MLSCGEGPETYTDLPYKILNGAIQKSGRDWVQKSGPGPQHYLHRQWEPLKIAFVQTEKLVQCCLAWGRGACDGCLRRFHKDKLKAGPTAGQNDPARWIKMLRCLILGVNWRNGAEWRPPESVASPAPDVVCTASLTSLLDYFTETPKGAHLNRRLDSILQLSPGLSALH